MHADSRATLHLHDKGRLKVQSLTLDTQGNALAQPLFLNTPITVKNTAIQSIVFHVLPTPTKSNELLILTNGDSIPCDITSIHKDFLVCDTSFAGPFKIPTASVSQIKFNQRTPKVIYMGPHNTHTWSNNSSWNITNEHLSIQGQGHIGAHFKLPKNFSFQCKLKWESSHKIGTIHLCSNEEHKEQSTQRYTVEFTHSKIIITRSNSTKQRKIIGKIDTDLKRLDTPEIQIEIRVNRVTPQIIILLNGKEVGAFHDLSFTPPAGNYIHIESQVPSSSFLQIEDIKIQHWNGIWEPKSDPNPPLLDVLQQSNGDSIIGSFVKAQKNGNQLQAHFLAQGQKQAVTVDFADISTLTFNRKTTQPTPTATIQLREQGRLSCQALTIDDKTTTAEHPILKTLSIRPTTIQRIIMHHK